MIRRLALIAGSALLVAAFGAPAALAAPTYPPAGDVVSVPGGSTEIEVGDEIEITAQIFLPGSDVTFTISSPLASLGSSRGGTALVDAAASGTCATGTSCVRVADSSGVATARIAFTQEGTQTITAVGVDPSGEPLTVTSTVTVGTAAEAADPGAEDDNNNDNDNGGGLANTGADILKFGILGLALIAVGGVLVLALRRRSPGSIA